MNTSRVNTKTLLAVVGGAVALAGIGVGGYAIGAAQEPEVVVETVEVTPQACTEALDAADNLIFWTVSAIEGPMTDALVAAWAQDAAALEAVSADLDTTTVLIGQARDEYDRLAQICRAAQ